MGAFYTKISDVGIKPSVGNHLFMPLKSGVKRFHGQANAQGK